MSTHRVGKTIAISRNILDHAPYEERSDWAVVASRKAGSLALRGSENREIKLSRLLRRPRPDASTRVPPAAA
jgi:hypothetical protein